MVEFKLLNQEEEASLNALYVHWFLSFPNFTGIQVLTGVVGDDDDDDESLSSVNLQEFSLGCLGYCVLALSNKCQLQF